MRIRNPIANNVHQECLALRRRSKQRQGQTVGQTTVTWQHVMLHQSSQGLFLSGNTSANEGSDTTDDSIVARKKNGPAERASESTVSNEESVSASEESNGMELSFCVFFQAPLTRLIFFAVAFQRSAPTARESRAKIAVTVREVRRKRRPAAAIVAATTMRLTKRRHSRTTRRRRVQPSIRRRPVVASQTVAAPARPTTQRK